MASSDVDDDDELRRAIALSLQDQNGREVVDLDSNTSEAPTSVSIENGDPPFLLGLNRKQMERERLARRRKRSVSPQLAQKRQKPSDITSSRESAGASSSNVGAVFQKPTVKRTWAFGHARTGDDIKLEEVLQKNDLTLAVLSSFQLDMEWLMGKLTSTQITLVMQAKDQATKDQYRRETADMRNLRLCFPSMDGQVNCMHSKLMLLSHPTYLRIAVPTANLVAYDWGESGQMENSVFLVDLPRRPAGRRSESTAHQTAFERELVYFLRAMGLENSLIESISDFDFTATKDLAFVHTIGGPHVGESWRRTGYCGLGRAIQELGLETQNAIDLDFVTSSVGSLNVDFLTMLYLAAQGDDGTKEYGWRNPETGKDRIKKSKAEIERREYEMQIIKIDIHKNFRIYFPTQDTVKASIAGYASTTCFQSKWYNSPTFPRQTLRDCKSTRPGLLMHNKILYVRSKDTEAKTTSDGPCWAYIGSANCSESAWGKLTKDRSTKTPKLNCRNWECGIVFPVRDGSGLNTRDGLACFEGRIPVPMQFPGAVYGDRKPWYYAEQR